MNILIIKPKDDLYRGLRKKFLCHIERKWKWANHNDFKFNEKIPKCSGVYILVGSDISNDFYDIMYVGSAINLFKRLRSHKTIRRVESFGQYEKESVMCCIVYFMELEKGFYDYEIKLIRKLQPVFNKKLYSDS